MIAFILLFNRRRAGEVGKMKVKNFLDAKMVQPDMENDEVYKNVPPIERELAADNLLVKLIGKRHRHVPLMIPSFMLEGMDMIVEPSARDAMGIPKANKFLFPVRTPDGHMEPCGILRRFTRNKAFRLKHPERIRTTKLRKNLATAVQYLNLQGSQLDSLARYMVRQNILFLC